MLEQHWHIDYSSIPSEIVEYDELMASEEWNNYSSYSLHIVRDTEKELDDYDLEHGRFGFKGGDLVNFWHKFVAWLTEQGLPEDVDSIYVDVFW